MTSNSFQSNKLNAQHLKGLLSISFALIISLALFLFSGLLSSAQTIESTEIAKTVLIADEEVSYGDLILYDKESNLYRLSQAENDPRFYGVVLENPSVLLETREGLIPVVETGVVPVNVILENGDIKVGDVLMTSSVPGKAVRVKEEDLETSYIFGFATEALTAEEAVEEDGVLVGTILVEVGGERLRSFLARLDEYNLGLIKAEELEVGEKEEEEGVGFLSPAFVLRFGFASLVALGSVFLVFFAFLSSIKQGVISVGRNPRAQRAIRSMVVLNVALALIITAAAVFFAISLLVVGD